MPKIIYLLLIIVLFASCKGCGTSNTETQNALLGVSLDASSTKDSTYLVTHDSTYHKTVPNIVKVPYDTLVSIQSTIDSVVHHDSLAHYNKPITGTSKVPSVVKTTHDTTKVTITSSTYKTTHDSFYCKKVWLFFNSCKPRSVTHDTTTYSKTYTISSITHDTTVYVIKTDTIGYVIKDTIVTAIHDTTLPITVQYHETLYRDSTVYLDVPYTAPTTHDTTVAITIVPPPDTTKIKWGLKISQDNFNNQLNVANQIGLISIRPSSLGVRDFNGDIGNVIKWKQAGLFTVMNVNWIDNPTEKPYNFVSGIDTVKFKANFERICAAAVYYADVIVMENEPTNLQYYNWSSNTDASNYIHELQMAIPIAHKYGLKIADGCVHLELVEEIRLGTWARDDKAVRAKTLMDAYKNLALDYVNCHTSYEVSSAKPTGYPVSSLKVTTDYLKTYTLHTIICNEYSMHNANQTVVNWFVNGFKATELKIIVPWSGGNADSYNTGTTLTDIGRWYRDGIK